jgi:hypothetical protein
MKRLLLTICTVSLVALVPAAALADWQDGFEAYAPGTSLHGVGGWIGWNSDPAATAYVSNLYAHGGSNSVEITGLSDLVHRYSGYTSGTWTYTTWMYIPNDFTGQTYFILTNTYPATVNGHWSVQVTFQDGQVVNTGLSGGSLPWIQGQWVEMNVVIDLANDMQIFYYNGDVLYSAPWTTEQAPGGALAIGAVDLYANGASPVYYDDLSLVSGVVATEATTWGGVKALFD